MSAYAGPAPWNDYKAVRGNTGTKLYSNKDMQWDLSTGWHFKRQKGWDKKSGVKGRTKKLTGLDGKKYDVYLYNMDDHIGFRANENPRDEEYQERLAYAEHAFDKTQADRGNVLEWAGVGHIAKMEYAVREQVLRVTFVNKGSICLFFRVPSAVAGTFKSLAQSKSSTWRGNVKRHDLGIKFWDYVRIRGSLHGAKYPWEYETRGSGTIAHGSNRHVIRLTKGLMSALLENDSLPAKRFMAQKQMLGQDNKLGEEFTVVLNDAEYKQLALDLDEVSDEFRKQLEQEVNLKESAGKDVSHKDDDAKNAKEKYKHDVVSSTSFARFLNGMSDTDIINEAIDRGFSSKEEFINWIYNNDPAYNQGVTNAGASAEATSANTPESAESLYELGQAAYGKMNAKLEKLKNDPFLVNAQDRYEEAALANAIRHGHYNELDESGLMLSPHGQDLLERRLLKDFAGRTLKEVLDLRHNQIKGSKDLKNTKALISAAFGKNFIRTWMKENLPAMYAQRYTGRFWTVSDLKAMANATVPGSIEAGHASAYKRFVDAKDWEGALNFLKTHKTELEYHDPKTGKTKKLGRQPYASPYDKIAEEE